MNNKNYAKGWRECNAQELIDFGYVTEVEKKESVLAMAALAIAFGIIIWYLLPLVAVAWGI